MFYAMFALSTMSCQQLSFRGRAAGTLYSYNRICSLVIDDQQEVWGHMRVASVRGEADYGLGAIYSW